MRFRSIRFCRGLADLLPSEVECVVPMSRNQAMHSGQPLSAPLVLQAAVRGGDTAPGAAEGLAEATQRG